MSHIAILGAGPTGLFAAHAARQAGHDFTVFSKQARKSHMNGAQYLHRPIPGMSGKPFQVDYRLVGTSDGYRRKVYGSRWPVAVSADTLVGKSPAWDIRAAYDASWAVYGPDVVPWDASEPLPAADLVISTVPRHLLCKNVEHAFRMQEVWSTDKIRYDDPALPWEEDNIVLLSGRSHDNWYRQSRIQGWENTEWPLRTFSQAGRFPGGKLWRVEKPISTDCNCNPHISHVGRYGRWTKGVLADSGYYDTMDLIGDLRSSERRSYV